MQTLAKLRAMLSPFLSRIALICFLSVTAVSAAEPVWPAWRTELLGKMASDFKQIDGKLAKTPNEVGLLSRRGDLYLFLGAFPEAVTDFEKMIALDPSQDAQHWRLCIAYYFTGQYAKSAK